MIPGTDLADHPALVAALAHVKAAAALANARAGTIAPTSAQAIAAAADTVIAGDGRGLTGVPLLRGGGSVAVNVAVNEELARRADVAPAELNRSQSTADVVHTAARLALLAEVPATVGALDQLAADLEAAGQRWEAAAPHTLARTCLQDALAVPTSLWPTGTGRAVARAAAGVAGRLEPLRSVVLGATVVGTGSGATEAYRAAVVPELAHRTGHDLGPHPDPAGALQHDDDLLALAAALAAAATRVVRIGRDLRLLLSGPDGGFGELRLPATGDGSTFFASKTNPIDAETAIQLGCAALGAHATVTHLAAAAELHLDVFGLASAVAVLGQAQAVAAAARALSATVTTATVDAERCATLAALAHPTKEASP